MFINAFFLRRYIIEQILLLCIKDIIHNYTVFLCIEAHKHQKSG